MDKAKFPDLCCVCLCRASAAATAPKLMECYMCMLANADCLFLSGSQQAEDERQIELHLALLTSPPTLTALHRIFALSTEQDCTSLPTGFASTSLAEIFFCF